MTDSSDRVQQFAPDGTFLQSIGSSGDGEGELDNAQTVTVDREGRVFVDDGANGRVQVFGPDGEYLMSWTGDAAGGTRFVNMGHIELDHQGNIYVADFSDGFGEVGGEGYEAVQKFRLLPPLG